jgi:hypothetical protein
MRDFYGHGRVVQHHAQDRHLAAHGGLAIATGDAECRIAHEVDTEGGLDDRRRWKAEQLRDVLPLQDLGTMACITSMAGSLGFAISC